MVHNEVYGDHGLEWDFPELFNQERIIERIATDLRHNIKQMQLRPVLLFDWPL
jgi:hypothetical protein